MRVSAIATSAEILQARSSQAFHSNAASAMDITTTVVENHRDDSPQTSKEVQNEASAVVVFLDGRSDLLRRARSVERAGATIGPIEEAQDYSHRAEKPV